MTDYAHPEYLIEAEELAGVLDGADLRLFDATVYLTRGERGMVAESGRAKYDEGHIPGAAFMDLIDALSDTSTGLGFTLPAANALQAGLRELGISNDSRVVVYSTGSTMWATRAWWLLHYAGLDRVQVLNGGLDAWRDLISHHEGDTKPVDLVVAESDMLDALDVNGSGTITITDVADLFYYLAGADPPATPFPGCGPHPGPIGTRVSYGSQGRHQCVPNEQSCD